MEQIDKVCSLSFNATQGNEDTRTPIHILGRYDVKAPFFVVVTGRKMPGIRRALARARHEVMSHFLHQGQYNDMIAGQIIVSPKTSNEKISSNTGNQPALVHCPAESTTITSPPCIFRTWRNKSEIGKDRYAHGHGWAVAVGVANEITGIENKRKMTRRKKRCQKENRKRNGMRAWKKSCGGSRIISIPERPV